ncbi:MAG: hypothetical protein WBL61_09390 [Bryobacteraceae bacterium]
MKDAVLDGFLRGMYEEGVAYAAASDIFHLQPCMGDPPFAYICHFSAPCYVRRPSGEIAIHDGGFTIGIAFPPDYLKLPVVHSQAVLQFIEPMAVWHPNARWPFICVGRIAGGTSLVELALRCFELTTFQRRANPTEWNALNPEACKWARSRWPVEPSCRLPLKYRRPAPGGQA